MHKTKMYVEIEKGSRVKYELDKSSGLLTASRITPIPYPFAYGFIPDTLAPDNDPLDIFFIDVENHVKSNTILELEIIGIIEFWDNNEEDFKIIGKFAGTGLADDTLQSSLLMIKSFLSYYKPNHKTVVGNILDKEEAEKYCKKCRINKKVNNTTRLWQGFYDNLIRNKK